MKQNKEESKGNKKQGGTIWEVRGGRVKSLDFKDF